MAERTQQMTRTAEVFRALREQKRKAFVPYITCGDPSLQRTADLVLTLEDAGAPVIELGVPFSDPLADGPVIQEASQRALKQGTSLPRILEMTAQLRDRTQAALVLFTYYNPVYRYGLYRFAADAKGAGVDAVLVPDLTPEEGRPLIDTARAEALDTVFLIAPTSTDARIKHIGEASSSFVYAVSLTGVTGARDELPPELDDFIARARGVLGDQPIVVGFGIKDRASARRVATLADGAVVGSALVKIVAEVGDAPDLCNRVGALAKELAAGVAEAAG